MYCFVQLDDVWLLCQVFSLVFHSFSLHLGSFRLHLPISLFSLGVGVRNLKT